MSKYYYDSAPDSKRSVRNKDLYQNMYEEVEYSNIEGIASIEKTNEIDLNKIREMLRQNESKKQIRVFEDLPNIKVEDEEIRNYDIKDILDKAKSNREIDNSNHCLSNTQYDILKKINLKDNLEEEYMNASDELKGLINTITNTSMLNKMGDKELSLNMFEELSGEENTVSEPLRVEKIKEDKTIELDKSFYTSSLNFNSDDFEDLKEMNEAMQKNNFLIKVLIGLLFGILAVIFIYIAIKFPIV